MFYSCPYCHAEIVSDRATGDTIVKARPLMLSETVTVKCPSCKKLSQLSASVVASLIGKFQSALDNNVAID